jgi:hypothetical protein
MFLVYENGLPVGYITKRGSGWCEFVPNNSYLATGKAAEMDETVGDSMQEVAQKLEQAGLTVEEVNE